MHEETLKLELLNLPYPKLTQQGGPSLEGIPFNLDWCQEL